MHQRIKVLRAVLEARDNNYDGQKNPIVVSSNA